MESNQLLTEEERLAEAEKKRLAEEAEKKRPANTNSQLCLHRLSFFGVGFDFFKSIFIFCCVLLVAVCHSS